MRSTAATVTSMFPSCIFGIVVDVVCDVGSIEGAGTGCAVGTGKQSLLNSALPSDVMPDGHAEQLYE